MDSKSPLVEARERAGLSQSQVARLTNSAKIYIQALEGDWSGTVKSTSFLQKLADLYDCGVCYLRGEFTSADLSEESKDAIAQITNEKDKEIMTIIFTIMESRKREE